MIVTIDNNVLFALITHRAIFNDLEFFLTQNNATLLIPTPVIAEFTAIDHNKRRSQFMTYERSEVLTGDLNKKAAFICGEFASQLPKSDEYPDRQKVKVDLQILAIAIANNAKYLISDDPHMMKYVKALGITEIELLKIKDIKIVQSLFE